MNLSVLKSEVSHNFCLRLFFSLRVFCDCHSMEPSQMDNALQVSSQSQQQRNRRKRKHKNGHRNRMRRHRSRRQDSDDLTSNPPSTRKKKKQNQPRTKKKRRHNNHNQSRSKNRRRRHSPLPRLNGTVMVIPQSAAHCGWIYCESDNMMYRLSYTVVTSTLHRDQKVLFRPNSLVFDSISYSVPGLCFDVLSILRSGFAC